MSQKIIAGQYKGRLLQEFDDENVRPTRGRLRQAAFNMLESRVHFSGLKAVDLFCGSGAMGIEALSRGFEHVAFVDVNTKLVRQNLQTFKVEPVKYQLMNSDARMFNGQVDVVFLDPPYSKNLVEPILENYAVIGAPEAFWLIETERSAQFNIPEAFSVVKTKDYGKSTIWLLTQK